MFKLNPQLPLPTTEYILSQISDFQIYQYYWPEIDLDKKSYNSPLRKDNLPSFSIYPSSKYNRILFYDHVFKTKGDCFVFVSKLFGISYLDGLFKICNDFGLTDVYIPDTFNKKIRKKVPRLAIEYSTSNKKVSIKVKTREWNTLDYKYWEEYYISLEQLSRYWVFNLDKVFINDWIIHNKDLMFGYLEFKDDEYYWKILQPNNKEHKWINNCNSKILQGYRQLPKNGEILIIEKALKDTMVITGNTTYASCGLQNEGVIVNPPVMKELKERFSIIYYLGDNDFAGIEFSKKLCGEYDFIKPIFIPSENHKNISDLAKNVGINYSMKILNKLVK
jgi:L-rhamnose mutarotase